MWEVSGLMLDPEAGCGDILLVSYSAFIKLFVLFIKLSHDHFLQRFFPIRIS
jgi:hypothetical protein